MFKTLFNKKYRYFVKKLQGVKFMIYDLEFKRYKTAEIREEIRQLYDGKKSQVLSLEEKVKEERKNGKLPEGDIKRIEDEIVLSKRDVERFEDQLKNFDLEINGSKPTAEYPQGVQGIADQLEALHELEQMLKNYISKL